ncbi:MAG: hypothetical protein F4Z01_09340 [Gammaproteobacteria bacterium]|nr:hypothetical protein [Gammaproteobacteria bacterium]MYF37555.1 hypothetical protein [Gammaproteobacteria bacterium]
MNIYTNPFHERRSNLRILKRKDDLAHIRQHVIEDYEPKEPQGTRPDFQARSMGQSQQQTSSVRYRIN